MWVPHVSLCVWSPGCRRELIERTRDAHAAKLRDLTARYTLRVRLDPVALVAIAMRVVELRIPDPPPLRNGARR